MQLSGGADDGAFVGSVAEAGESAAVVRSFKSSSCKSDLGPTDVAEKMSGNVLKMASFSIAVAMIPVHSLELVSRRPLECSSGTAFEADLDSGCCGLNAEVGERLDGRPGGWTEASCGGSGGGSGK